MRISRPIYWFVCLALAPGFAIAQLTPEQRLFDFEQLVSVFAKNYGPYEWKRDRMNFDLYRTEPWVERIRAAKDDLEYQEILSEYVASLQDAHSQFVVSSNFSAAIGLGADIYDGRVLVDTVDRTELPEDRYPIHAGDEVLSIGGREAMEIVRDLSRFIGLSEPRSRLRAAAGQLFSRPQALFPRAQEVGETAVVAIRHAGGNSATYEIPWVRRGVPVEAPSPIRSPKGAQSRQASATVSLLNRLDRRQAAWQARLRGIGSRNPYFRLPDGFQPRLGRNRTDVHYSGIYEAEGKRIGFLRIPSFSPSSSALALFELQLELAFLNENTDGLVVDVGRNPGGSCFGLPLLQMLIPWEFELAGEQLRATLNLLADAETQLAIARILDTEEEVRRLEEIAAKIRAALDEDRGLTERLPICASTFQHQPQRDRNGNITAYNKPMIVLVDEFTISWGDHFAAAIQDNGRGKLFGYRTNGAGGQVSAAPAGFFTEAVTTFSQGQGARNRVIGFEDVGATNLIENAGVRPEIVYDVMTEENLRLDGAPYVAAFTKAILDEIAAQAQATGGSDVR
ncbi:MAG: S41 family peptidase [Bryobacteraceae bacterium]